MSFDKFKIIVSFKLSGLRTKRIFTPYGEVIVARRKGFSASATCCNNRELALKRLRFKLQEFNFVICNFKDEIDFRGKKIIFCTPDDFILFLKEKFGFKVGSKEILDYDLAEEFLKSFDDKREALGILNSIYLLYLYREFPEVFIHTKNSRMRMEIEPDIPLLEKVKNMGYGFSHPKTSHPKVRMNYLTEEGREMARSVLAHRLRSTSSDIESHLKKFGEKKTFLIVLGTLRKDGMFLRVREPHHEIPVKSNVKGILLKLYTAEKSLFKELKDVQTIQQLVARFITIFTLYEDALRFFGDLERLGLALKVRIFSKWGADLGTAYRAPLELAEVFLERCFFELDEKTYNRFLELFSGLYLDAIKGVAGERMLNELYMGLDLRPVEKVELQNLKLKMAELISEIVK
jgi:hypothetical protein